MTNAQSWDERYRSGEFASREADEFVTMAQARYLQPLLTPGARGLDLAGGAGRHALWLARQGWSMTLADWSGTALAIARERSTALPQERGIELEQCSALDLLMRYAREGRRFGFVLVSFFLDRAILPQLPQVITPGGLLLYRTYTQDNERFGNPRGPRSPEHLVHSQELLETFRAMKILYYSETVAHKGIAELIAQRAAA